MEPAGSGQRLDAGEINVMPAFAAKSGLEQFVPPFFVPESWTGAGDGGIQQWSSSMTKVGKRLLRGADILVRQNINNPTLSHRARQGWGTLEFFFGSKFYLIQRLHCWSRNGFY